MIKLSLPSVYLKATFLLLLMPSFYYGSSLGILTQFISYGLVFLALFVVLFKQYNVNYKALYPVILFYVISQVVLIFTVTHTGHDLLTFSALPSVFRPSFLFLMFFIAFLIGLRSNERVLIKFLAVLTLAMLLYNIVDLLNPSFFEKIHKAFYFREKFEGKSVFINFFFTSYSTGYVALVCFLFFCSLAVVTKKMSWFVLCSFSLIVLIMAQSKTMFIAGALGFFIISLYFFKNLVLKMAVIFITLLSIYYFINNIDEIFQFLRDVGFRQAQSLYLLLVDRESSGTLNLRKEQILHSFELTVNNPWFLGAGLGRDVLLESWISSYLYRYGLYGPMLFISAVLYIVIYSFKMLRKHAQDRFLKGMYLGFMVWGLTLPISQMSSPLNETGKTAALTMLVIGLMFALNERIKLNQKATK